MKLRICLALVFLFSLLGNNENFLNCGKDYFSKIEKSLYENYKYNENGVKLEYKKETTIEKEIDKLYKELISKCNAKFISKTEEEISMINETTEFKITCFQEDDNNIKVNFKIINRSENLNTNKLEKVLEKFQDEDCKEVRHYKYIKADIENINSGIEFLKYLKEIEDMNTLEVHNGYISTGKLINGERVNISLSSYNSGTYLIIGTPIIFATY